MYLRRSDRRVLTLIIAVVVAFWGGVILERRLSGTSSPLATLDEAAMDTLAPSSQPLSSQQPSSSQPSSFAPLPASFTFDPNTADSATLMRAGLRDWQVRNLLKYRSRGGRYHRVEDFKRLYGMTPELYDRLAPHIRISKQFRYYEESDFAAEDARRDARRAARQAHYDSLQLRREENALARKDSLERIYPHQEKFTELVQLDLNAVDSATLKKVPGIASYRARQILRYRDRLGGFVSITQLSEIENFPADELASWFKVERGVLRHLKINSASVADLGRHPYIGFARARAIETYRRTNGAIHSLAELRLLPEFTDDVIRRIEPYIEY